MVFRLLLGCMCVLLGYTTSLASSRGRWIYRDAAGVELPPTANHSVARRWNDALLSAIRRDLARPTIHARNLYHVSIAMWDSWAAYDTSASQVVHAERAAAADVASARRETISYACYRLLRHRFAGSPGAAASLADFNALMVTLGYDPAFSQTVGTSPAALGNRIAASIIAYGLSDGANEQGNYANQYYQPVNFPMTPAFPVSMGVVDPNRWQPLAISFYVDQNGNVVPGGSLQFLSPEWGQVRPFALRPEQSVVNHRGGFGYRVYLDPGAPPLLGTATSDDYKRTFEMVAVWSAHLHPSDGVMWNISPSNMGNAGLPATSQSDSYYRYLEGGGWGSGHPVNPLSGAPYPPNVVPRGDFARVLAEYWADGPSSETPPGHWFKILNHVHDHPLFERRFEGTGPLIDVLEWDVKAYLILGGAMHDAAIAAWGVKGWYDGVRPITALRYMASLGQSSDPALPSYHPNGITLRPGYIELITQQTTAPGGRHREYLGFEGEIAFRTWRGPDYVYFPDRETAGVGWILGTAWWPYQQPTFVSPPFAGYVSGHSTFSRAGAEVLTQLTGSPFFPGGMGEYICFRNQFLVTEDGPSVDVRLQWATYFDASEQSSFSRIWGGIHPPADDLPGRQIGSAVGQQAFAFARGLFEGVAPCSGDANGDGLVNGGDLSVLLGQFNQSVSPGTAADFNGDGAVNNADLSVLLARWNMAC